jgi:peptidoglycan/LPS O-acetylase OafA/YrhL
MLCLLYCSVKTFRLFFSRRSRLGRILGELSYGVYIIHMIVLGLIALVLLQTDIPALLKYPILTVTTFLVSNLLVFSYKRAVGKVFAKPAAERGVAEATPIPVTAEMRGGSCAKTALARD